MKNLLLLFVITCLASCKKQASSPSASTAAGDIITIAGNGTAGYSGDGGSAINAKLDTPVGVAVDAAGNIYIADCRNNRIRKINSSGIITTIAGNGIKGYSGDGAAATAAELYYPGYVTVDVSGNIYFAEGNNTVRKVNTAGIITTIAGNGVAGFSGDGGAATSAELNQPAGIAVDNKQNVYIADYFNSRIRKVDSAGIITTIAGNGGYGGPSIYGMGGYSGDGGPAVSAELNEPLGVVADVNGNIFIADNFNNVIRKVDTAGIITTVAGNGTRGYSGDGGPASAANLFWPSDVKPDSNGNLYIADFYNQRIRMVNTAGIITTVAGNGYTAGVFPELYGGYSGDNGPATLAKLNAPAAIALDGAGNLYIADVNNNRIRKVNK